MWARGTERIIVILVNGSRCERPSTRDRRGFAIFRASDRRCPGSDGNGHAASPCLQGDGTGPARAGFGRGAPVIGVAILGAGIGREHLAGYRALPGRFDVRWLCDLDTARAKRGTGDPWTAGKRPTSLSPFGPATVDVSMSACRRIFMCRSRCAALRMRAKHVVLEKPIAPSLAECDQLAAMPSVDPASGFSRCFSIAMGAGRRNLDALIAAGLVGPAAGRRPRNALEPRSGVLRGPLARHLGRRAGRRDLGSCHPQPRSALSLFRTGRGGAGALDHAHQPDRDRGLRRCDLRFQPMARSRRLP
jgi:hypothetical protein